MAGAAKYGRTINTYRMDHVLNMKYVLTLGVIINRPYPDVRAPVLIQIWEETKIEITFDF
jgi:hypothetical protein